MERINVSFEKDSNGLISRLVFIRICFILRAPSTLPVLFFLYHTVHGAVGKEQEGALREKKNFNFWLRKLGETIMPRPVIYSPAVKRTFAKTRLAPTLRGN